MTARVQFDTDTGNATLRVGIYNEFDGQRSDMVFNTFPVRIGRNRRNDLVLLHEYVSQWHAVIGFVNGQLSIVQVGSSNSVRVDGRKLLPNEIIPLRGDEEIRVVPFRLQTTAEGDVQRADASVHRADVSVHRADVSVHRADASVHRADASVHQADPPFPPEPLQQSTGPQGQYPPPTGVPLSTGPQPEHAAPLPGPEPAPGQWGTGPLASQVPTGPQYGQPGQTGAVYMDGTPSGGEAFAILNRISEQYWGRPLQNAQEAAYMGARLEMILGRLLEGVISLRNGQLLFLKEMGIKHRDDNVVDQLENAPQLGAALLAGQDQRIDGALEDTFERLKLHQVALLRGLEAGVKVLLRKLGPGAVEKQVRSTNTRSLWDHFCQLHGDLEEGQARFKLLYGAQFKKAYSRLLHGKKRKTGKNG